MRNILATIGAAGLAIAVAVSGAMAADYPLNKPREQSWSFAGPFGTYDKGQLQRGLKVYQEVCSSCHGLERVAFRTLEDLGYSDAQIKAFAAEFEFEDGPNDEGEMFTRPGRATDKFPSPFENEKAAAYANNGAIPPDLSLIAKARAVERGFPLFVIDIFTQYAENGPDYLYSLLTGYKDEAPAHKEVPEGLYYNPYFNAGSALAMAPPLYDEGVEYDDGTVATIEQQAKDVTAFLMWAAEPSLQDRKEMGFRVMIFLVLFAALLYLTKKQVWSRVEH
ncbi:cytochrome c1 [Oricola sp.]|uniref:cytochrome c1 n=1 Tax=Oricola sp. TaxID=1979950 RepID=UPI003BAC62D8